MEMKTAVHITIYSTEGSWSILVLDEVLKSNLPESTWMAVSYIEIRHMSSLSGCDVSVLVLKEDVLQVISQHKQLDLPTIVEKILYPSPFWWDNSLDVILHPHQPQQSPTATCHSPWPP